MKAIIVNHINKDNFEAYSIGNEVMYNEIKKTAKQIIRTMRLDITDQERYELGDLTSDEIVGTLQELMDGDINSFYHN